MTLSSLPTDVRAHVFIYLPLSGQDAVYQTCREWAEQSKDERWKTAFRSELLALGRIFTSQDWDQSIPRPILQAMYHVCPTTAHPETRLLHACFFLENFASEPTIQSFLESIHPEALLTSDEDRQNLLSTHYQMYAQTDLDTKQDTESTAPGWIFLAKRSLIKQQEMQTLSERLTPLGISELRPSCYTSFS